ncbi:hypothetical protein BMAGN_1432 [Bifidobacterium magnum]|uniref:Uncharacterized protein n=1 Tax=Bifidobacterium magnum TaxID=1692 RepID=A0A087B674_9BIFI|nr:hypothetical protein BMAGN_1432 [Bifidobacterium magnum]
MTTLKMDAPITSVNWAEFSKNVNKRFHSIKNRTVYVEPSGNGIVAYISTWGDLNQFQVSSHGTATIRRSTMSLHGSLLTRNGWTATLDGYGVQRTQFSLI